MWVAPYRVLPARLKRGSHANYDSNIMSMSCHFLVAREVYS
jgi:hypothetical protein